MGSPVVLTSDAERWPADRLSWLRLLDRNMARSNRFQSIGGARPINGECSSPHFLHPFAIAANSSQGTSRAGLNTRCPSRLSFQGRDCARSSHFQNKASALRSGGGGGAPHGIDSFTLGGPTGPGSFPLPPAPAPAPAPTTMTAPGSDPDAGVDSEGSDGGT
jgi:hypothetical protein